FRRDPTDALFADQSQSILDNLVELLGPELSACYGATEAARSVAISNVSRPSSAKGSTLRPKSTRPDRKCPATASRSSSEASLTRGAAQSRSSRALPSRTHGGFGHKPHRVPSASTRVTTSSTTMTLSAMV